MQQILHASQWGNVSQTEINRAQIQRLAQHLIAFFAFQVALNLHLNHPEPFVWQSFPHVAFCLFLKQSI